MIGSRLAGGGQRHLRRVMGLGLVVLGVLLALAGRGAAAEPTVLRLAVVRDGPSWQFDRLVEGTLRELTAILGPGQRVETRVFDAGWRLDRIAANLEEALADPRSRLVLAAGILTTQAAARRPSPLPKPVLGGFFADAASLGLPAGENGALPHPNLGYLSIPGRVPNDYAMIAKLFRPRRLHLLIDAKLLEGWRECAAAASRAAQAQGIEEVVVVPAGERAQEVLARLEPAIEALYYTPPLRMPPAEQKALIAGLAERRIRTFALLGQEDVERGILAGLTPRLELRLTRRLALNLQQAAEGASPAQLPGQLAAEEQLFLNQATMRRVGFWPDFDLALGAILLGGPAAPPGRPLELAEAMRLTAQGNLEAEVQRAATDARREDETKAQSYLLPRLDAQARHQVIDADRADASLGLFKRTQSTAGVGLNQVLFDDAVFSRWRAAGNRQQKAVWEEEAKRLDLFLLGAQRYLGLLSARALANIAENDLRVVQKNLELARVRVRVGISGREEVLRLEAAEAQRKSSLARELARGEQARLALNQAMNAPLATRWDPGEVGLESPCFPLLSAMLEFITNLARTRALETYLVKESQANSPGLKALDQAIAAQETMVGQLERSYYLPTLGAQASYNRVLDKTDPASPPVVFTAPPPQQDRDDWSVGLVASFPLYEGGGRGADLGRARADLRGLAKTRERAAQLLDQRVRAVLENMGFTHPHIALSRRARDSAEANLQLVQDKYAKGKAGITDLLDAQNEALRQEQAASLAVYQFLLDYLELQRAVSWFEADHTPEEARVWRERFLAYHAGQAGEKGTPR